MFNFIKVSSFSSILQKIIVGVKEILFYCIPNIYDTINLSLNFSSVYVKRVAEG